MVIFISPALFAAIFYFVPVFLPLLSPSERFSADNTGFFG
ncbi:MAG: hypothetical protein ACJAZY_000686 [Spirosomataceae bacterium]|jgi:hypothetical protein